MDSITIFSGCWMVVDGMNVSNRLMTEWLVCIYGETRDRIFCATPLSVE